MGERTIAPIGLDEGVWEPVSSAVLLRTRPQFDELVLDVCSGSGETAVPTAELVGPGGLVDAVDHDEALVEAARGRAGERMPQLRFHVGDASAWETVGYDLVQCAHGLPFADTEGAARHLVSLVKPGGRFAVAVWARGAFEPLPGLLAAALEAETSTEAPPAPDTAGTLARWLHDLGLVDVRADAAPRRLELDPELAWALARGRAWHASAADLDDLDDDALARVRERYLAAVAASETPVVEATVLIGVGRIPV